MARVMAEYYDPRSVFEAAAFQYTLRVTCSGCQHSRVFDPHALWWLFERKGWDQDLKIIPKRFRCQSCTRHRWTFIELTRDEPDEGGPPMPDPRRWKRAVSRYR